MLSSVFLHHPSSKISNPFNIVRSTSSTYQHFTYKTATTYLLVKLLSSEILSRWFSITLKLPLNSLTVNFLLVYLLFPFPYELPYLKYIYTISPLQLFAVVLSRSLKPIRFAYKYLVKLFYLTRGFYPFLIGNLLGSASIRLRSQHQAAILSGVTPQSTTRLQRGITNAKTKTIL